MDLELFFWIAEHIYLRIPVQESGFRTTHAMQDAAAVDPRLQDKLHAVDQQVGQLAAQLSEAQSSVRRSQAETQEERHKVERLEQDLGDARNTISNLEAAVAASKQQATEGSTMEPNSGLERNRRASHEVCYTSTTKTQTEHSCEPAL